MKQRPVAPSLLTRREATRGLLAVLGGAALLACGGSSVLADTDDAGTSGGDGGGTGTGDSGTTTDSGTSAGSWASGGTKSMKGGYADPFPATVSACALAVTVTEGPCTEAADQVRTDISEGYTGLPMRLALRVLDASCKPIAGAKVKVWHTQINGSYSGNTPNNGMCLKDQADASKHYFRGAQTTDAAGRVDFDSCFPGWYRGRTVHIHFSVTVGSKTTTSQVVFDQALVQEIFASHPEYASYGQPDTTNASDNVVGRGDLAGFTLTTSRLADGAMMAFKDLVVST